MVPGVGDEALNRHHSGNTDAVNTLICMRFSMLAWRRDV